MLTASRLLGRRRRAAIFALAAVGAVAAASLASGASGSRQNPRIAYLSFAVANSYDAPMLKAARAVAKKQGATVDGLRRGERPEEAALAAPDRLVVGPVRRNPRAADLRAAALPDDPAGDRGEERRS